MKRSMVTFLKGILSVIVALVFSVTVSGCQKEEGPMEKAGKKVDENIGEAKDTMKKAGEKVDESVGEAKDTMKKAGEKVDESVDKAKDTMDDAAQKAEEKNK